MKDGVHSCFEKRFQAQVNFGVNLDGVQFREIGVADNEGYVARLMMKKF